MHEMEEDGSTPDVAAFQTALDALKDAAQWEKAMDLISEMDELGVRHATSPLGRPIRNTPPKPQRKRLSKYP